MCKKIFASHQLVLNNQTDKFFPITCMQSWAKFEPSKTTVKRILLQEHHRASMNGSSFLVDKQHFNPHMLNVSAAERPLVRITPSTYSSQDKGEPN